MKIEAEHKIQYICFYIIFLDRRVKMSLNII